MYKVKPICSKVTIENLPTCMFKCRSYITDNSSSSSSTSEISVSKFNQV